jgi:hypothetical protein
VSLRVTVIPGAPLLVPAIAGGSAAVDGALRASVRAAVRWLLEPATDAGDFGAGGGARDTGAAVAGSEPVVVLGVAPATAALEGSWDWRPFGVPAWGGDGQALPTALAVGACFLDDADPVRPRSYLGVSATDGADACRRLGAGLVASAADVRLLVVADGSACRSEKAPGHLDPRAEAFDATLVDALRTGDPGRLLGLDPALGAQLLAAGRAPLQVLAGAAEAAAETAGTGGATGRMDAVLDHVSDPYGVLYAVARWWWVAG